MINHFVWLFLSRHVQMHGSQWQIYDLVGYHSLTSSFSSWVPLTGTRTQGLLVAKVAVCQGDDQAGVPQLRWV